MLSATWKSIVFLGPEGSSRRSAQMTILSVGAMGLGSLLLFLALLPAGAFLFLSNFWFFGVVLGGGIGGSLAGRPRVMTYSWMYGAANQIALPMCCEPNGLRNRVHPRAHGRGHGQLPPHVRDQDVHQPRQGMYGFVCVKVMIVGRVGGVGPPACVDSPDRSSTHTHHTLTPKIHNAHHRCWRTTFTARGACACGTTLRTTRTTN